MNSYRLTARADRDIFDIILYGLQHFGLAQAEQYWDNMTVVLSCWRKTRASAARRIASRQGLRRHEYGSHVILYEPEADGVTISPLSGRSMRGLQI